MHDLIQLIIGADIPYLTFKNQLKAVAWVEPTNSSLV
jgi:hypothetical protein